MSPAEETAMEQQTAATPRASGLRLYPGYLDRASQMALVAALEQNICGGTLVYSPHAEIGPADVSAHVQLRSARLDHR